MNHRAVVVGAVVLGACASTRVPEQDASPPPITVKIYDVDRCQRKVCECQQMVDVLFRDPITGCDPNPFGRIPDDECEAVLCRCRQMIDVSISPTVRACEDRGGRKVGLP